jgi:peptide/nickel transport system substrate-binding protein
MKLVKHVPAEVMEFERHDDYYFQPKYGGYEDRRPKFSSLRLLPVPEEATRVAAIRSGQADIAPASLAAKGQIESDGGRLVYVRESAYPRMVFVACWKDPSKPCIDQRVRQALIYALDKELIRDTLFGPEVMEVRGWGHATPSAMGYASELDPFPYDPEKARQLLADAGYPGGEGFGEFKISTFQSSVIPFLTESAQVAADMWKKELGIEADIVVKDEGAHYDAVFAGEVVGWLRWEDNEGRWDGSGLTSIVYGNPDREVRPHNNPEIFELMDNAMAIFDPEERDRVFQDVYRRLKDEAWEFSIGYVNAPWAVNSRVLTWGPYPLSFFPGAALHTVTLE